MGELLDAMDDMRHNIATVMTEVATMNRKLETISDALVKALKEKEPDQ